MLMIACSVCYTPRSVSKENERYLILCSHVKCPDCSQLTEVTQELKDDIKRKWGMFHDK